MSSPRISADGLYYWDGGRWVPTGARAVPPPHPQAAYRAPVRPKRTATSWTRPLQWVIAAWFGLQCAITLVVAAVVAINLGDWVNAFVFAEERAHPQDALPPPGFAQEMTATIGLYTFVGVGSLLALGIVIIAGASKRWGWTHYVAIVALALEAATLPLTLFYPGLPDSARALVVILAIASAVLCVVLIAARVRRGPWATTTASAGQ